MSTTDENEMIRQLQDEATRVAAFTRLVNQYKEPLYWQIRRMVTNHDDADDILQNTFIKIWNALDSFRGYSKLSTWLYRITANETLNFLQRQHHPSVSLDDEESHVALGLQSDPYFDGDETQRMLQEAISQLPPKQREVFNLKYFDEMKYEEMSEILGTSIGALKASYHHAVRKVSEFFQQRD